MTRVLGVVLAGGASSRYGRDKCFAMWRGVPFLTHVATALADVSDAVVVTARHGADPARYSACAPGARIAPDARAGAGPLPALLDVLRDAPAEWVVVAGCDSPALDARVARRLLDSARASDGVAVVRAGDAPVHSLFAGPVRLVLERAAHARRLGEVTAGARDLDVVGAGWNVNRPEQASPRCPA